MPKLDHFRAFPRQPVVLDARVTLPGETSLPGRLVNISPEGACLELWQRALPGERLHLAISIPSLWDPLEVEAVVVWTDSYSLSALHRVGVHFAPLNPHTLKVFLQMQELPSPVG